MKKILPTFFVCLFLMLPSLANAETNSTPLHYDSKFKQFPPIKDSINDQIKSSIEKNIQANYISDFQGYTDPNKVVKHLTLTPGMKILDLGAGYGLFTFFFAQQLQEKGTIYATDIDPARIKFIANTSKKYNFKNIKSVLVQPFGVDPFYKKHSFDLIFISEVYYQMFGLQDKKQYFESIRPSLNKDGILCMIEPKYYLDLYAYVNPGDVSSFILPIQRLQKEGPDFPIFQRLSEDTKSFILSWDDEGTKAIPKDQTKKLLNDLNNMLNDRTLILDIVNYYTPKNQLVRWTRINYYFPQNSRMMNLLTTDLMTDGLLQKEELTERDKKHLLLLNRMIILESLGFHEAPYGMISGPENNIFVGEKAIIDTLSRAGYEFIESHDVGTRFMLLFKEK